MSGTELTLFHCPSDPSCVLVSCKIMCERVLVKVARDAPIYILARSDGTLERLSHAELGLNFEPIYGQPLSGGRVFPVPPPWTLSLSSVSLPDSRPDWFECLVLFAWSPVLAAIARVDDGQVLERFASPELAVQWLTDVAVVDTVMVIGAFAQQAIDEYQQKHGALERWRTLPVLCDPDQFIRGASMDRSATGAPVWYRPPFDFEGTTASDAVVIESVAALVAHRCAWVREMRVLPTMFELARLTRLPLHVVARPQQTELADALIERVWMENLDTLAPPELVRHEEDDDRKFRGAGVLDAWKGLHTRAVAMPDVRSLYPNVVREWLSDTYPLMARLFAMMIKTRAECTDPVARSATKVITNAVFGSRKHGRYRCIELAEEITALGRRVQEESIERVKTLTGVAVIGGDTDALAVVIEQRLDTAQTVEHLVRTLNAERTYVLYNEKVEVYQPFFFVSNKSWAGVDAGRIVTRGLMQNRSVTPQFVLPAHREWIRRVLLDGLFRVASVRAPWIQDTADELCASCPPLDQLMVWPKPTRDHPSIDRGYFVLKNSHTQVPRRAYMNSRHSWPPVDIEYLVRIYFTDEVLRHHELLPQ